MITPKLSPRAVHLLKEIAEGRARIFYADTAPPGFGELQRANYAQRLQGTDSAAVTQLGHERYLIEARPELARLFSGLTRAQKLALAARDARAGDRVLLDIEGHRMYDAVFTNLLYKLCDDYANKVKP